MNMKLMTICAALTLTGGVCAAMPELEPCFSAVQIEKGAPRLSWTRNADGSESTFLALKDVGIDLADVKLTRRVVDASGRRDVVYTLENGSKGMRYASFGWRSVFSISSGGDRNWIPTTENVLDLSSESSLWGYYRKPGPWHFSLVEPWFASYNSHAKKGYGFLFDFNTLSSVYGAGDLKTRGVLFDGGLLPPGARFTVRTTIFELRGLSSVATLNESFAAGFSPSTTTPELEVCAFRDLTLKGTASHIDVNGVKLAEAAAGAAFKAGETRKVCVLKGAKPASQTILSAELQLSVSNLQTSVCSFELFRENGFRMAPVPMMPAEWTHRRAQPKKTLSAMARFKQVPKDKALLLFGFWANFFRFEEMYPELKFTKVPMPPSGLVNVPPASTLGEYRAIFMGDVNEESVRAMITRLVAYVRNGGTLVVGGGPFAFGCGGYKDSLIGEMMPVVSRPFDCLPACVNDPDGRTAVAIEGMDAKVFWIQRTKVKDGAEVLLKTKAGDPLLVKSSYGEGTIYAFLGAPIGDEARDAKAFWNDNRDYLRVMREKLNIVKIKQ